MVIPIIFSLLTQVILALQQIFLKKNLLIRPVKKIRTAILTQLFRKKDLSEKKKERKILIKYF